MPDSRRFNPLRYEADAFRVLVCGVAVIAVIAVIVGIVVIIRALT
jgi:hypothetical protein